LLQAPLAVYAPRTLTMPFDASDASGWDECLPSVAGCTVKTANGLAAIPDHGDLWRVEWTEQKAMNAQEGTITLRGECFSLPLVLDRTLTLAEMENGWQLGPTPAITRFHGPGRRTPCSLSKRETGSSCRTPSQG